MGAQDDSLGGMTWECLAVSLDDVRKLLDGFRKTRDENEKILRRQLEEHLVPILEKQEESRKRKALQHERELLNLAKMANAKRSSRIANKIEQQKQEEKTRDVLRQHREAEESKRREEHTRLKREQERDFRLASRGKRLEEREARRLRYEEELAQLSEDSRRPDDGNGRVSERRLQVEIERNRQALQDLEDEDDDWVFDCVCGLHGQIDDGTHSVACEKCNVWQHSKCLGISEDEAERSEFHFICGACRRRQEGAKDRSRATIKLKVNRPGSSNPQPSTGERRPGTDGTKSTLVVNPPSHRPGSLGPQQDLLVTTRTGDAQHPSHPAPFQEPTARLAPSISGQHPHQGIPDPSSQPSPSWGTKNNTDCQPGSSLAEAEGSAKLLHTNPQTLTHNKECEESSGITKTPSPSKTPSVPFAQLPGQSPVHDSTLSTPAISRDIYRAAHTENGSLPAQAGLSPTKHSPHSSFASVNTASSSNTASAKIHPGITLSPTPQDQILTPPTKHPEPIRTQSHQ